MVNSYDVFLPSQRERLGAMHRERPGELISVHRGRGFEVWKIGRSRTTGDPP